MGIAPNLKTNIYGNSSDPSQGRMTSQVMSIGINNSGTVATVPSSNLQREKGNHVLTFVIDLCYLYLSNLRLNTYSSYSSSLYI